MKPVRFLSLLLAGLLISLPLVSGETRGDPTSQGGGTGVWVLPRLGGGGILSGIPPLAAPRDSKTVTLTGYPLVLNVAPDMVDPIASLVERQTQQLLPIQVQGNFVTIMAPTLAQIAAIPGTVAEGIIIHASTRGYLIRITAINPQTVTVDVF